MIVELFVHKSIFYQSLAIIEDTIHFQGCDVTAERCELTFLDFADLSLGIENVDVDAVDAQESIGDSRPRIAGGGNKHVYLVVNTCCLFVLTDEIL